MLQGQEKETRRQEKIQWILEEFRGIKNISNIKYATRGTLVPKVINEHGETVTSRKGTANVIGEFDSKLYADERPNEEEHDPHRADTRKTEKGRCGEEEEKTKYQSSQMMSCRLPSTDMFSENRTRLLILMQTG